MRAIVRDLVARVACVLPPAGPVVEFGACQAQPGFGDLRPFFDRRRYVGCDIGPGPGVDVLGDVQQAALAAESVGCVVMIDALEHVESPQQAIDETYRILRPGGAVVLASVMNYPIHDPIDYWRFTPRALSLLLRRFAWAATEAVGAEGFPHTVVAVAFKASPPAAVEELARVLEGWRTSWSGVTSPARLEWGDWGSVRDRFARWLPPVFARFAAVAWSGGWSTVNRATGRIRSPVRLPRRSLSALFPGIEQAIVKLDVASAFPAKGTLPPSESLTLAAICHHLQPCSVLEIGTFTGGSTLVMAMNLPPASEIVTVDLPPADRTATRYRLELGDIAGQPFVPGQRYRGTPFESRVRGVYADSAALDFSELGGPFDMIFIDGNHSYENVRNDSLKSHAVLRPGGVMIWDDYDPVFGPGVMAFLHHWARTSSTYHVQGTRFAVYRSA
jgi:predicted O-methyltransferase YrrM